MLSINYKNVLGFLKEHELEYFAEKAKYANELLETHTGKKNKKPTERRNLTQEKSIADIEAFFADCTEKEKEILLRNLWNLRADLRSVEDGYNRDR